MPRKNILTIGAYERDNFGDTLFFTLTNHYLSQHHTTPASILYANTPYLGDGVVYPYNIALENSVWDAVWIVGGEIGAVDIRTAYKMSLPREYSRMYVALEDRFKADIYQFLNGETRNIPAYLPQLDQFKLNQNTPLIMNSVGLSNLYDSRDRLITGHSRRILKSARTINVRDSRSLAYCKEQHIETSYEPDLVHSLAIHSNLLGSHTYKKHEYILFQASVDYIENNTVHTIEQALAGLYKTYKKRIVFFAAGTSEGHDSFTDYEKIAVRLANIKVETSICYERDPSKLASIIRDAFMWVGTSLHGRIVAASFAVPRISLQNAKVSRYASDWDPLFPYDVLLSDLNEAANLAVLVPPTTAKELAVKLAKKADANIKNTIKELELWA